MDCCSRIKKSIFISFVILAFFCSLAYAAIERPAARYSVLFNNDIRHSEENFYAHRVEVFFTKKLNGASGYEMVGKMIPFVDLRYSVERRKRERTMTGVEFGLEPLSFFYVAQQFRYSWYSEALHETGIIENTNRPEALTKITLSHRLIPGKEIVTSYLSGEYTYDFRDGRGARIETIIGLLTAFGKDWEANLDWRHRDRIHNADCDTFEASVAYNF